MAETVKRISFDEFSENLTDIFDRVLDKGESILIEKGQGELLELSPVTSAKPLTDEAYEAFRSAFGGWADVDTDALKKNIYESRKSARPPVEL